jgi:hypothetical protein
MTEKISKTNDNLEFFNSRLDEIRLSGHERLKAKAHLARAEAFAEAVSAVYKAIAGLFNGAKSAGASAGRTATSAG